jgi:hypothetical protein
MVNKSGRLSYLITAALVFWYFCTLATPPECRAQGDFSFLVMGHSKTYYFLPGGRGKDKETRRMLSRRQPGRVIELFYDPMGVELTRIELGPMGGEPRTNISYREGWPHRAVQWIQGKPKVIMRQSGQKWVYDRVIENLWRGARSASAGPTFAVHAGEAVMWGGQGVSALESPYWQRFKSRLLDKLPPPDLQLGQPTRLFMTPGEAQPTRTPACRVF